ncbi:DMT family transporter [Enterovirga rhinocerotis]|uniref:Threonine/homoserine efflux transporter RhtA n=1 Tax=Enterovirga rhinocerotis TaxID=1339210 RepID=A0A4R7C843_9HYPH|nr:DMT family transporter [Enterovirga rhinocerotis]TDR94780.1 threonine/homoserine efflux transporter RhtA [Enterovirga rhinocerotis]
MHLSFLNPRWSPRIAIAAMLVSMLTAGANFAVSRHGIQHGLSPWDLVFLRFAIGGTILLPFFVQKGWRDCAGVGWGRGIVLALTSGALITTLMSFGSWLAPAAHGAALGPGTVTVVGVVYAAILAGRLPPGLTIAGIGLALAGLAAIAVAGSVTGSRSVMLGDLCYFAGGFLWGFYPVLLHRWRIDGMTGAAICAVLSLVFVPIYLVLIEPRLFAVPVEVLVFQALYQGIVNSIVVLWLWGHGVKVLGAGGTQLFPPMIPVVGTIFAIPILGEWPGPIQVAGIALIVAGLAAAARGNYLRMKPKV